MTDVTLLLNAAKQGEPGAADRLLALIYSELRRLATAQTARESPGRSLLASDLVQEAYLQLIGPEGELPFDNRGHFFAAAAQAMRRLLVDAARRRGRLKRGGLAQREPLDDAAAPDEDTRLLELDEALANLAEVDPQAARIVELRQFGGLTHEQAADALGTTVYEVRQKWIYAVAWLKKALS